MKTYYIYETTNLCNGKKYIGQHIGEINDAYLGSGVLLKKAILKYGAENFQKRILCVCSSKDELDQKEKEYIAQYDAVNNKNYYNLHEGGNGGNTTAGYTPEQKAALSKKFSELASGENNPMYGKRHSEQSRQKMSIYAKDKRDNSVYQTDEFKEKMSVLTSGKNNGMYGRHHTEESKALMSEHRKGLTVGEKNGMYGKHHTKEARQKMSEAASQRTGAKNSNHKGVNLYSDSDRTILKHHFETIQEALAFVEVKPTNYSGVNRSIKANRPYKGYYWEKI